MTFVRWMFVSLAYGAILYVPLFFIAVTGLVPTLPDWTVVPSALGGMLLGGLGPLRHLDWITGE